MTKISGPVNVTRMTGNINGINKTIYIFMDEHVSEKKQTKCANNYSPEIQNFFNDSFSKLNKSDIIYDFFVEFQPAYYLTSDNKQWFNRNIYLDKVLRFFKKNLQYDPQSNIVDVSKKFKNVRFHYIDIRDWLEYYIFESIDLIYKYLKSSSDSNNFNNIISMFSIIINQLTFLKKTFQKPKNVKNQNIIIEELPDFENSLNRKNQIKIIKKIRYLIGKFLLRYKHDNIKKIINQYIKKHILPEFDVLIEKFKFLAEKTTDSKKNNISNNYFLKYINERIKIINNSIVIPLFAQIMDIYFLRRFLDKDYITNAIVYVGSAHGVNYINILANLFGFKITHTSSSTVNDIEQINKMIKKYHPLKSNLHSYTITEKLLDIFFDKTENIQCSDLSTFPKSFL